LDIALVLESWWWPFRANGWGRWRCDLGRPQAGVVMIDVDQSAVAAALGRTGYCECHLYAGLFAGAFSRFTTHELAAVEFACTARGNDCCKFVVAAPAKVERARSWRDSGFGADDILRRITSMGGHE
jgi:predicted hydrocarbon binding protein